MQSVDGLDSAQHVVRHNHFLKGLIDRDIDQARKEGRPFPQIALRFPPEPNGFLHIGHAKSICLNFGLASYFREEFNDPTAATCFLRFDDTNPQSSYQQYVDSIQEDVRWLGFEWDGPVRYSSDYFHTLAAFAKELICNGDAYVCSLSPAEMIEQRGTPTSPGEPCQFRRHRSIEENLEKFQQMHDGKCADGEHVLRARIDMASPNMHLRDPVLYRIRHSDNSPHFRTGDRWCIYPSYDFTHCLADAMEGISHSFCTLEFQDHRAIYEWLVDRFMVSRAFYDHIKTCAAGEVTSALKLRTDWDDYKGPVQTEFARLNLSHTITSKRKLALLVNKKAVAGWDDPRLPTLAGLRTRGVPSTSIREFCAQIGVARADSGPVEMEMLDASVRSHLNKYAPRAMAVMDPVRVKLTNWNDENNKQKQTLEEDLHSKNQHIQNQICDPKSDDDQQRMQEENHVEVLHVPRHPQRAELGHRDVILEEEIFIERRDFFDGAHNKKYKRLSMKQPVRLRGAYVIHCQKVERDSSGEIHTLHCRYDPKTLGTNPQGYRCKGVIHWVPANASIAAEMHFYTRLFDTSNPGGEVIDKDDKIENHDEEDTSVANYNENTKQLFLSHLSENSHIVRHGCLVEPAVFENLIDNVKHCNNNISKNIVEREDKYPNVFQFERLGYFTVSPQPHQLLSEEKDDAHVVLCRQVTGLRESY